MFTAGDSHRQGVPDPFGKDFEQALRPHPVIPPLGRDWGTAHVSILGHPRLHPPWVVVWQRGTPPSGGDSDQQLGNPMVHPSLGF
jgi:hypothetical protein